MIHSCFDSWTQYHFVAANNEIVSVIYLLKDRLFKVEITETLDSIISYKVERYELKNFIKFEMKFLFNILNKRRTNEGKSAIELSEINHGDNNIFIEFIETVEKDLENLLETS